MSVANFSRWTPGRLKKSASASSAGSGLSFASSVANLSLGSGDNWAAHSSSTSSLSASGSGSDAAVCDFGTLIIVVMKAKNLYNRRAISKQNPYCSVRVAKHSNRTKAITRGGQAPVWDHETRFKLSKEDDNRELKLCVFDQNGSNTEIIGDAVIPLQQAYAAPPDTGHDGWFPIHFNKRYVGEVYLEMTFYPVRRSRHSTSSRSSPASTPGTTPKGTPKGTPSSTPRGSVASVASTASEYAARPPSTRPRFSGSAPTLHDAYEQATPLPVRSRPLPQVPQQEPRSAQEDIQRQINDGYEASLFERLKPSASQPFP